MKVRRGVLDAIEAHARRAMPEECCGLLLGTGTDICEAVPARNVAANPERRYEIDPAQHFAAIKRCRSDGGGMFVVGAYHSHPRSRPVPSPTDLEQAFLDFIYLIAGPVDGAEPIECRVYRLCDGALRPVIFSISD